MRRSVISVALVGLVVAGGIAAGTGAATADSGVALPGQWTLGEDLNSGEYGLEVQNPPGASGGSATSEEYPLTVSSAGDEAVAMVGPVNGTRVPELVSLPDGGVIDDAAANAWLAVHTALPLLSPDGDWIASDDGNAPSPAFSTFNLTTDQPGPDVCANGSAALAWASDTTINCLGSSLGDGGTYTYDYEQYDVTGQRGPTTLIHFADSTGFGSPYVAADTGALAWQADPTGNGGSQSIELADADGSHVHEMPVPAQVFPQGAQLLGLSPDGAHVLVTDPDENAWYTIAVADAAVAQLPAPPAGSGVWSSAAWSPDSQWIAGTVGSYFNQQLIAMSVDTGAEQAVTTPSASYTYDVYWTDSPCADDADVSAGDWAFGGCFSQPDSTDYAGKGEATLDGVVLDPRAGSRLDFSDGGSSGDQVTDAGAVDVSLDVSGLTGAAVGAARRAPEAGPRSAGAGSRVLLAKLSSLNWSLSGSPVSVPLQSGTKLLGVPVSGSMTFTPGPAGTVTGKATATLPGVLGGGKATVSVTSVYGSGVTAATVTAARADLAGLLALKNLKLSYSGGSWQVTATATPPGSKGVPVSGSLSYDSTNTLTSASLDVRNAPLAGMVTATDLHVGYADGAWSGTAQLAQAKASADLGLSFDAAGHLTGGHLHASNVTLFGVLALASFDLDVTGSGQWSLSITPKPIGGKQGATASAQLAMAGGAITGANLTLGNVEFLHKLKLDSVALDYAVKNGHVNYGGKLAVAMPGPLGSEISGKSEIAFQDQKFNSGSVELDGLSVPIGWGAVLHKLDANITTTPLELAGGVGISLGPKTPIGKIDTEGKLGYNFATATYTGTGSISVGLARHSVDLGTGGFTLDTKHKAAEAHVSLGKGDGTDGINLGKLASLHGTAKGTITAHAITLTGTARFDIAGHPIATGQLRANTKGMAACTSNHNGFTWNWGQQPQPHFNGTCNLTGY